VVPSCVGAIGLPLTVNRRTPSCVSVIRGLLSANRSAAAGPIPRPSVTGGGSRCQLRLEMTPGWKRAFCSGQKPHMRRIFAADWSTRPAGGSAPVPGCPGAGGGVYGTQA
jgi:hypothetical protein